MTLKFYLDKRHQSANGEFPLKIVISHRGKAALFPLGINLLPHQYNETKESIESHPNRVFLNNHIQRRRLDIQEIILQLTAEGKLNSMTATEVKNYVKVALEHTDGKTLLFIDIIHQIESECKTATKDGYVTTEKSLRAYCPQIDAMTFDGITFAFLDGYIKYLRLNGYKQNTIHLLVSKIKTVFNYAIDRELTSAYPFRKIKLRRVPTAKRALTVDQLRELFAISDPKIQKWIDIFKLTFCLIGINTIDLYELKEVNAFGRVEYSRHKTHKEYSIKVEPETAEIIDRYNSDFTFGCKSALGFKSLYNYHLRRIGKQIGIPCLTSYWARHTWATIAAELDIPRDTIAHALGHGNNTVTDIYINFNSKKVDEANRKVLDYVFHKNIENH